MFVGPLKTYNSEVIQVACTESPKTIVRLAGDYDLTRKEELSAIFSGLDGQSEIVIDMRDVTYIDSTVLRELACLHLRDPQRLVSLHGVKAPIRRILSIVGFDRLLNIA